MNKTWRISWGNKKKSFKIYVIFLIISFASLLIAMPSFGAEWTSGTAGTYHGLALKPDRTLWAWGLNHFSQLGDDTTTQRPSPVQIGSDTDWASITGGFWHSLALKTNGTLFAWGDNSMGQLGDGTHNKRTFPLQTGTATNWHSIAAGLYYNLALKSNGTLWAWGDNSSGQLGDGTTAQKQSPLQIGSDTNWGPITAGDWHSLALKLNGTLWAWGRNSSSQLGDGTNTDKTSPIQVGTAADWHSIAAGSEHSLALKTNGTLWAWGDNEFGQLGDGTNTNRTFPIQVGTAADWVSIAAGSEHSLALKSDGTLWAWGKNDFGQLGDGTNINRTSPIQVGTATDWVFIDAGFTFSLARKSDRTLWAWGNNGNNQLGDGTTTQRKAPVQVGVTCIFGISPDNASYPAGGGGSSVSVTTPDGCAWAAVTNNPWIEITSGTSRIGSGPVLYSVQSNTGPARTGTLTIEGLTFTVTQAEAGPFTISILLNLGGSVSCFPTTVSLYGSSTCTLNADPGYHLAALNDNGADVLALVSGNSYTISNVTADHSITASFALNTFTITGTVTDIVENTGLDGVVMNGLPGTPMTDGNGNYTATVPYGWTGRVTPFRTGYLFDPTFRDYSPVAVNQTNQDYSETPDSTLPIYEDQFSNLDIDTALWNSWEFVREIRDLGVERKLFTKTAAYGSSVTTNRLDLKNPEAINHIEADVTVIEMAGNYGPTASGQRAVPYAQLAGHFYNDGTGSPGSYLGDVTAEVRIQPDLNNPNQLLSVWVVSRATNSTGASWAVLGSGGLSASLTPGQTYRLSLNWDPLSQRFTFGDGTNTGSFPAPPAAITTPINPANISWKALRTYVLVYGGNQMVSNPDLWGKVSATYDNVLVQDSSGTTIMTDDFSSAKIDKDKWVTYEFVREIADGKLISKVRNVNFYSSYQNSLLLKDPDQVNEMQARVALKDYQNPDGLYEYARLGGFFYNDTGDPGSGYEGEVQANVRLNVFPGQAPTAGWTVTRHNDPNATFWNWTVIGTGTFPLFINLDQEYELSLKWDGTQFIFKCDDYVAYYTPTPSIFPSNIKTKWLNTQIFPPATPPANYDGYISATFDDVLINRSAIPHTITATAGSNGSISPSGDVSIHFGSSRSFNITANTGYHVADVLVDGISVGAVTSYGFNNVITDHTIAASFAINTYTISASAGAHGSISSPGVTTLEYGANQAYTITADTGYHITDVWVDGVSVGPLSIIEFNSISDFHTVSATFDINTYTITAMADLHGSISPAGNMGVNYGDSLSVIITPDPGYHVKGVAVNGMDMGPVTIYPLVYIMENKIVSAVFEQNADLTITVTPDPNTYTIPGGESISVPYGGSLTLSIGAAPNYVLDDVLVNGISKGPIGAYTFTNVTENQAIRLISGGSTETVPTSSYAQVDSDGDGVPDAIDNCPKTSNNNQLDPDGDGFGDICDSCPNFYNPDQKIPTWYKDYDNDGYSDGVKVTQCNKPSDLSINGVTLAYKLASELKGATGDCVDSDPTVNPENPSGRDANCNPIPPQIYDIVFNLARTCSLSGTACTADSGCPAGETCQSYETWLPGDGKPAAITAKVMGSGTEIPNIPVTFSLKKVTYSVGKYTNDTTKGVCSVTRTSACSKNTECPTGQTCVDPSPDFNPPVFSGNTISLISRDYGGSIIITANAQVKKADGTMQAVTKDFTLPKDSDGDGLPDSWVNKYGKLNPQDDLDGDGLTNFDNYRGFMWGALTRIEPQSSNGIYQTPAYVPQNEGTPVHFRGDPAKKHLFIKYANFDPVCGSNATYLECLHPFAIGVAFDSANIAVHVLKVANVLTPTPNKKIHVVFINNEKIKNASGTTTPAYISKSTTPRFWTWQTKGFSNIGNATTYGSGTTSYQQALDHYFVDKPYLDGLTNTSQIWGPPNGLLDPLNLVEDNSDTGVSGSTSRKGDIYIIKSYAQNLSTMDINNNKKVELPFAWDPININLNYEYTMAQVLKHTVTHELGHAAGVIKTHTPEPNCVMYQSSINWSRDNLFGPTAQSQIKIHNK